MTRPETPKRLTGPTGMARPNTTDAPDLYDPATARVPAESVLFALLLKPLPGSDVPAEVRSRAALKRLLRSHGLRAVAVRQVGAGAGNAPEATGDAPAALPAKGGKA